MLCSPQLNATAICTVPMRIVNCNVICAYVLFFVCGYVICMTNRTIIHLSISPELQLPLLNQPQSSLILFSLHQYIDNFYFVPSEGAVINSSILLQKVSNINFFYSFIILEEYRWRVVRRYTRQINNNILTFRDDGMIRYCLSTPYALVDDSSNRFTTSNDASTSE